MKQESNQPQHLTVRATPGALALLETHRNDPRTTLAVTRAMFNDGRSLPDRTTTLVLEGGLLSVHFDADRNLALLITTKQAWQGVSPALEEALVDVSTEFGVA